jgi:hypothetical protein
MSVHHRTRLDQRERLEAPPAPPQLAVECIKCKRQGWFDKTKLVEKLGETYLFIKLSM